MRNFEKTQIQFSQLFDLEKKKNKYENELKNMDCYSKIFYVLTTEFEAETLIFTNYYYYLH